MMRRITDIIIAYMLFYNSPRPHSTLQYKTPDGVEANLVIKGGEAVIKLEIGIREPSSSTFY